MKKKPNETTTVDNVPVPQEAISETPETDAPVVPAEDAANGLSQTVDALLDAFVEWGKSDVPLDDLEPFVKLGLLNEDHSLTDKGCELLDLCNVPYRVINMLVLGIPVTFTVEGQKYTVQAGSILRVKHNGRDRDGLAYHICDCGQFLPEAYIYAHTHHTMITPRYPLNQPLAEEYSTKA